MSEAVVLVDHGSREPAANALLEEVAERVRERLPGIAVKVAHMELAEPTLAQAIEACAAEGARRVTVHPYFLAPGRHSTRDIPRMAREIAERRPGLAVRVTEPLGAHPGLVDAVCARLEAADEGAGEGAPAEGSRSP